MGQPLDILVLETWSGAGESVAASLEEAGHRVHSCFEPGAGPLRCKGLTDDGDCPLDGSVDAAVLVRPEGSGEPSLREAGVRCVLRADKPLVSVGREEEDPFTPWVTVRTDAAGVAEACRRAVERGRQPFVDALIDQTQEVLAEVGLDVEVWCRLESADDRLRVFIEVDAEIDARLSQRIGVRAYDVVRRSRVPHLKAEIDVRGRAPL